jgi:hypothetical protein
MLKRLISLGREMKDFAVSFLINGLAAVSFREILSALAQGPENPGFRWPRACSGRNQRSPDAAIRRPARGLPLPHGFALR